MTKALILGGTGEARQLAATLTGERGLEIVSSLAGRVRAPLLPAGAVRVGGFGGAAGLRAWLQTNKVDAVIDATHPFATQITRHGLEATASLDLPFLVLQRPAWTESDGDRWTHVVSLADAATRIPEMGRRVFATVGRQGVSAFADVSGVWFLIRAIDPPDEPLPVDADVVLERGPFTVAHEAELLERHRIDLLISKNSGGSQTAAKLDAAAAAGISVLMIDRPTTPDGVHVVDTAADAASWLRGHVASC